MDQGMSQWHHASFSTAQLCVDCTVSTTAVLRLQQLNKFIDVTDQLIIFGG